MVAFRNLASETGPQFTEEEVKALAAESDHRSTEPTARDVPAPGAARPTIFPPAPALPGRLSAGPLADRQGAAVNRGFPTFIFDIFTQYQETGPDYIYSLLTGYQDPPAGVERARGALLQPVLHLRRRLSPCRRRSPTGRSSTRRTRTRNKANDVPETVDQYAKDVTAFLMWAAEPHMVDRKAMGLTVMVFLVIFACLVYYTKKKVWATIPGEA